MTLPVNDRCAVWDYVRRSGGQIRPTRPAFLDHSKTAELTLIDPLPTTSCWWYSQCCGQDLL